MIAASLCTVNRSSSGVCLNLQPPSLHAVTGSCEEITRTLRPISGTLLTTRAGVCGVKATSKRSSSVRFGQFELDLSEERLRKRGLPVRLENQPYQILAALIEHPGEMVSREELCASL